MSVVVRSTVVQGTTGEVVAPEPSFACRDGDEFVRRSRSDISVNGGFHCPHQQIFEVLKITFDRMEASRPCPWKVWL